MGRGGAWVSAKNPHRHVAPRAAWRGRRRQRSRPDPGRGDRRGGRRDPSRGARHQDHRPRKATRARHLPQPSGRRRTPRLSPIEKKQVGREIAIPPGATGDAEDGDLVAVEVAEASRLGLATGRVKERLGSIKSERAVSEIAIHTHGIPMGFCRGRWPRRRPRPPADCAGREDLRDVPLITIDPVDASDHDDAVHAEPDTDPKNPGGWIVRVAIADVAPYVRPGSALDRIARDKGNRVYFPDRVEPMLPERLSNGLCSLREGEDRPPGGADGVSGPTAANARTASSAA